jgi:hypothetical protein
MVREIKEVRHESSDFASSDSDKSDWDTLTGCISNPDSVDFNDDVTAAMAGHAVVVDSNDETKESTCDVECECQIVRTKEGLRALKTVTQYYDTHGSDNELQFNLYLTGFNSAFGFPVWNFPLNRCACLTISVYIL